MIDLMQFINNFECKQQLNLLIKVLKNNNRVRKILNLCKLDTFSRYQTKSLKYESSDIKYKCLRTLSHKSKA
jgi:hypothetical protein